MKVTVDGTDREGNHVHNEWTGKFDGKTIQSGDPAQTRGPTRKSMAHLELTIKKDGKVTLTGVLSSRLMAKTAPSLPTEPIRRGRSSKALQDDKQYQQLTSEPREDHSTTEQEAVATWPLGCLKQIAKITCKRSLAQRPGRYRFLFCS